MVLRELVVFAGRVLNKLKRGEEESKRLGDKETKRQRDKETKRGREEERKRRREDLSLKG